MAFTEEVYKSRRIVLVRFVRARTGVFVRALDHCLTLHLGFWKY